MPKRIKKEALWLWLLRVGYIHNIGCKKLTVQDSSNMYSLSVLVGDIGQVKVRNRTYPSRSARGMLQQSTLDDPCDSGKCFPKNTDKNLHSQCIPIIFALNITHISYIE